jgi:hypothetical protein
MFRLKKLGFYLLIFMLVFQAFPAMTSAELIVHGTITSSLSIADGSTVCFTPSNGGDCIRGTITNSEFDLSVPADVPMTYHFAGMMLLKEGNRTDWLDLSGLGYDVTISNGKTSGPISIVIPTQPVSGSITWSADNSPISSGNIFITSMGASMGTFAAPIQNGVYTAYLKDGDYRIFSFYDQGTGSGGATPYTSFTVTNGVASPSDKLNLAIQPFNVSGKVQRETVDGIVDFGAGMVNITDVNDGSLWFHSSIQNGQFQMTLPDGDYRVNAIFDQTKQTDVPFTKYFSVVNGQLKNADAMDILIKGPNVVGTLNELRAGELIGIARANIDVYAPSLQRGFQIPVNQGTFETFLDDGTYQINGFYDFKKDAYVSLKQNFEVENGHLKNADRLDLITYPDNVFGSIQIDSANGPVALLRGNVQFMKVGGTGYSVTVKLGEFSMYLPDGTYQITGYTDQSTMTQRPLKQTFTVENGVLKESAKLDLLVRQDNVSGTLERQTEQGKAPVKDAYLNLYQPGGNGFSVSVKNGAFNLYLEDGTYQIGGYWDPVKQEQVSLNGSFTVANGQVTNPDALHLLVRLSNLTGTLRKTVDTGVVAVTKAQLNIRSLDGKLHTNVTVKNGAYSVFLEDGVYILEGYWDEVQQQFNPVNQKFTVQGGALATPGGLDVLIRMSNVNGTLKGVSGANLNNVNLNLYKVGTNYGFSVTVKNGKFNLYLEDGTYQINGFWDNDTQSNTTLSASFEVEGGQVTAATAAALQITLKAPNVSGTLKKQTGTSTYTPVQNGWLNMHAQQGGMGYGVQVKNGGFALNLPDGTYIVDGYWDNVAQQQVSIRGKFFVLNGHLTRAADAQLVVRQSNVKGKVEFVSDSGTLPVSDGVLNMHTIIGGAGFSVSVKDGSYDLYLPDGVYQVDGVWKQDQSYLSIAKTITILNGQVVGANAADFVIQANNIFGTVDRAKASSYVPVNSGWVNIRLTQGQNGFGTQLQNGKFGMFVEDGTYQIDGFWDNELQVYTSLAASFTVSKGAVTDPNDLKIKVEAPNVEGTLKKATANIRAAWLNLRDTTTGRGYGTNVKAGQFKLYLPDGAYQIDGYWDELTQVYVPLSQAFEVQDGALVGYSSLALQSAAANVSGTLSDANGNAISDVWLNMTSPTGDPITVYVTAGKYSLYLADGTYSIDGYWDDVNQTYVALFGKFTVSQSKVTTDTAEMLNIDTPAANVEGALLDAQQKPLTDVWVVLTQLDDNGDAVQSVNVLVRNGKYQIGLADGTYRIDGYWAKANVQFIEDGTTFDVQQGQVVDPTATIYSL